MPVGVVLEFDVAPVPPKAISKYENPPVVAPLPVLLPYGSFQPLGQSDVPTVSLVLPSASVAVGLL